MRAVVVYESMFGNTRLVAETIAEALSGEMEVRLVRATSNVDVGLKDVDLLVVGSPTHAWGLPRPATRRGGPGYVRKPGSGLALEPGADSSPGVREWLATVGDFHMCGAAFDTRINKSAALTGRASRSIARSLQRHGIAMAVPPESFRVDRKNHLLAGEIDRARAWAVRLGAAVLSQGTTRR